jgi:hypothetical protein
MSSIHQIQMVYQPLEDRILMRVSSTERAEFRFWMTRRYVKLLWQVLVKMMERDPAAAALPDEKTRRTMVGFQHEDVVRGGQFNKPFAQQSATLPLGETPVLLSRISGKPGAGGYQVLAFHPESGQGIDLNADTRLLHLITKLLMEAVKQSDWDLKLVIDPDFLQQPQDERLPPHKLN